MKSKVANNAVVGHIFEFRVDHTDTTFCQQAALLIIWSYELITRLYLPKILQKLQFYQPTLTVVTFNSI